MLHPELQIPQHTESPKKELVHYDFSNVPSFRNKLGGAVLAIPKHMNEVLRSEISIPDPEEYKDEEVEYKEPEVDDIAYVAVALFFGYIDAATTFAESHGGGGGSTSGWGKDKNDDDMEWMRRYARMASHLCRPRYHPRIKRGGYHM